MKYYAENEEYTLEQVSSAYIARQGLSLHKLRQLKQHDGGSLYRMNAASADCYAFSIDKVGQKHMDGTISTGNDWSGGWDWSNALVDTGAEYVYMFSNNKFYQVTLKQ